MPFSFNPTVSNGNQEGGAPQGGPLSPSSSLAPDVSLSDAPQAPESPFLYLQERNSGSVSVNAYLQMLLLLISALLVVFSISLVAYGFYLSSAIEDKKALIASQEASFQEYSYDDMKQLSARMTALSTLLKEYVSIRSPLKLLEDVVENRAYFDEFSLTREKKGGYTASFLVVTTDYPSLIQQLEALKLTQYTKVAPSPKVEKFTTDAKQNLTVRVVTPVIVQGVLPDEVVFLSSSAPNTTTTQEAPSSSGASSVNQDSRTSSSTP